MTSANRTQLGWVREVTAGSTPNTPRMRTVRFTGESLSYNHSFVDSDELRTDRMNSDSILVFTESGGGINGEVSYPDDNSPRSDFIRSALYNAWNNSPSRDNDGTADSVITAVATSGTTVTHTTGAAFVASQLVKFSGFGVSGNNGIFKCSTGGTTSSSYTSSGITDEAVPPAAARMKVVGFQGAAADITATSTGLGSTLLDFTTLGLSVGMWVKIGGTAAGDKFATAALNDWMRITAITANALTLDNRPSGWTTDAGAGKTIKVFFGDWIKNGTTQTTGTLEKGFMGQSAPTYIVSAGMTVNQWQQSMQSRQKATESFNFGGMGGSQGTSALDASYDAATTGQIMAANANVGRIGENGSQIASPNWCRSIDFTVNNNQRSIESVDQGSPVAIREGECTVTGTVETYFGDNSLLTRFYAGTATAINLRVTKNSQAIITEIPRLVYQQDGNPQATAKNTDVMVKFGFKASYDSTTAAHIIVNRLEYYE